MVQTTLSSRATGITTWPPPAPTLSYLFEGVLGPVGAVVGADGSSLYEFAMEDQAPCAIERAECRGAAKEAELAYSSHLFRNDPIFNMPPGVPARWGSPLTPRFFKNSRGMNFKTYKQELADQNSICDMIGIHFPIPSSEVRKAVSITFYRRQGHGDFSASDLIMVQASLPLIKSYIWHVLMMEEMQSFHSSLAGNLKATLTSISGLGRFRALSPDKVSPEVCWTPATSARPHEPSNYGLTKRELEIVEALQAGHSNFSAAHLLGISVSTVENHLRSIFAKTCVTSRTQLVMKMAKA